MSGTIDLGDVTLHYESAGEPGHPLAVLLHGFPDTSHTFRYLMPYLAGLGYHAVAPSMRGYAPSSVATTGYSTAALAHDANRIHEALGGDSSAVLIGHDWGAATSYPALATEPDRWRKAVTMAVPPLALMAQAFMTYEQLQNSWYMFFFQSPLADFVVGLNDLDFIEHLWSEWSPGYDASEDLAHVRQALGDPAHLSAALGYYRAMFAEPSAAPEHAAYIANQARVPDTPVLYLHGAQDGCIAPWVAESSLDHLAVGSEMHVIDHAGHFVHLEQVDEVHHLIGEFLGR